ncbi:MAG: hypothetical protein IJW73_05200 [Candidatus Gastranaerophilales bacterium]|nr:hypothetical protein [Candidatus Gastranaerophilales bacterium]
MINTGSYYGQGLVSGSASFGSATGSRRIITSSNINSMSRNTAAGYEQQMEIIEKYLKSGEVDKAIKKYESLMEDAQESNSYGNYTINESQAASILNKAYANVTGSSFMDDLDKKTASPFWSGLVQGIPLVGLFCNDTTKAEAFAKLDGDKVSFKDKFKEYLGAAASGAATGAAFGAVSGFGLASAPFAGVGAVIGGIIGFGQAVCKDLF